MVVIHESGIREENCKIIVANFLSAVDHWVLALLWNVVTPCIWNVPKSLAWCLGYSDFNASCGRKSLVKNVKKHLNDCSTSILVFPEGATTSGQKGLLKFASWPWNVGEPVQAVTIEIYRPMRVSPSVLGGRWWTDALYTFFCPLTIWKVNVLPIVARREDESDDEIALRYQEQMAHHLQLSSTNFTCADKVELAKNRLFKRSQGSKETNRIDEMVKQVLAVLPHVSPSDIKKQLLINDDVEVTIAHLVENPLDARSISSESLNRLEKHDIEEKITRRNKKADLTSMSLQERKDLLLQEARRSYLKKHDMKNM
ncbi:unnamed protein product [Dimorphilus gyrociliatus]|uniref:CUE domain-containing protein n=1 Tax=Dimorphilus gyrociliatus TaxID=2664684 RepID=A0A7I8W8B2_9ANNE|nr:unnamed protein product [Dimorphilus gyrociliatus]